MNSERTAESEREESGIVTADDLGWGFDVRQATKRKGHDRDRELDSFDKMMRANRGL